MPNYFRYIPINIGLKDNWYNIKFQKEYVKLIYYSVNIQFHMQTADYDITIVGGGLVGLSLALALQSVSARVALISVQALTQPVPPDDRSLVLSYTSGRILSGLGVWDLLKPYRCSLQHIHISSQGRFAATRLSSSQTNLPAFGWTVNFSRLVQTLQDTCLKIDTIEHLWPAQVINVSLEDKLANVTVQTNEKKQRTFTTRLLIAADGANSTIRQLINIPTEKKDYDQVAIVTHFDLQYPHDNIAYERFTKQGVIAVLPHVGKRVGVVWALPKQDAQSLLELNDDDFYTQWQHYFSHRLGPVTKIHQRYHYPLQMSKAEKLFQQQVVLIGNAAQTLHPVAAQGFNLGLRDVACLAEILHVNNSFTPNDIQSKLTQYASWREPDRRALLRATDTLASLHHRNKRPWLWEWLQDIGLFSLDTIVPLKNRLIHYGTGQKHRLPKLACGIPLNSEE